MGRRQNALSLSVCYATVLTMLKHCSISCADISRRSLALDCETERSYCISLYTLPRSDCSVDSETSLSDSVSGEDKEGLSLNNTIRVYANCLRPHLAYKTIMISVDTTSRDVITGLLARFRMRHRDPKLYYLTIEVTVNSSLQTITLDDSSRPAELISCNPWGGGKFILRSKSGGMVKIYDEKIRNDSVYKCIIISQETTVADTLSILLCCYHGLDNSRLCLYESDPDSGQERLLDLDLCPLQIKEEWRESEHKRFVVRFHNSDTNTSKEPNVPVFSDENGFLIVKRKSFLRQSVRKKNFLKSMICGGLKAVEINIEPDSNSIGDTETETESDESELNMSEEDFADHQAKLSSLELSEEDSLDGSNGTVILESFFT